MSNREEPHPTREDRVGEAVAWYYQAAEAGNPPEPATFLARFPDLRPELESFLADKGAFDRAAGPPPAPGSPDSNATLPPSANNNTATLPPSDPSATVAGAGANTSLGSVRYFGDYELLSEVARGGMGVVFRARQVSLNREVALKMILTGQLASSADVARFRAEAEAAANLDHPNVLPIYEVGEHQGQQYFAMKLVPGGSLAGKVADWMDDPKTAVAVFVKVCRAVDFAHRRGILHRDLKPGNVLLDDGTPFVTDFGLAKKVDGDSNLTQSGAIVGTPSYMAPEQARAEKQLTTAADVYALGAILYELLTGRPPFRGPTVLDTILQVLEKEAADPRSVNPKADRDLSVIALKCLEKSPAKRYETAAALADDLDRWMRGEPVSVSPATRLDRLVKWIRRKPTLAAAYALTGVSVLLVGLVSGAVWLWRAAEEARGNAETAKTSAEIERENALTARKEAEEARDGEKKARAIVESARDDLAIAREKVARIEYGRAIQIAHQEWRENNLATMRALFEGTRPDLRGWEWHYLHRLDHAGLVTFKGHKGAAFSVSYSPDGTRVASAGQDGVKVWNPATGTELLALRGYLASFSPDGSQIVTGSAPSLAQVWDSHSGKLSFNLKGHAQDVTSAAFSRDGSRIVTASFDRMVKVWDAKTGTELFSRKFENERLQAAINPDGSRIVTGNSYSLTTVWDTKTGTDILTLKGHTGAIRSAVFSPDGSRIVTASEDRTAKVWDAKTGNELLTLQGHTERIQSAAFSENGIRIVTAGDDGTAKVWDAKSGKSLLTIRAEGWLYAAAFSPDGKRVVTGGYPKVWDATTSPECRITDQHVREVVSVAFTADGAGVIATCGGIGMATLWDVKTGRKLPTFDWSMMGNAGVTRSMAFSTDGQRVVTGGWSEPTNLGKIRNATTGAELFTLKGHTDGIWSAAFSPDGSRVVTTSHDKTARVWDAKTGAEFLILKGHTDSVMSALFSPDGSRIVTASADKTAKMWDAKTGAELFTLRAHQGMLFTSSFSADGLQIVTASADQTARIWDAKTGAELLILKGHISAVLSASFSPDGSRIVTASYDRTAKLWETKTGAEVLTLKGHTGPVRSAVFSPDGWRIATGSDDRTVRVWDASPLNREFLTQDPHARR